MTQSSQDEVPRLAATADTVGVMHFLNRSMMATGVRWTSTVADAQVLSSTISGIVPGATPIIALAAKVTF